MRCFRTLAIALGSVLSVLSGDASAAFITGGSIPPLWSSYARASVNAQNLGWHFSPGRAEGSSDGFIITPYLRGEYDVEAHASVFPGGPAPSFRLGAQTYNHTSDGPGMWSEAEAGVRSKVRASSWAPEYLTFNMHVDGIFSYSHIPSGTTRNRAAGLQVNINTGTGSGMQSYPTAQIIHGPPGNGSGATTYIDGFTDSSFVQDSSAYYPTFRFEGNISYRLGLRMGANEADLVRKFNISMLTWATSETSTWAQADFSHSLELTSITVPDGRTIEQAGVTVEFLPVSSVPEPSTFALLGIGSVCMTLASVRRRRNKRPE